MADHNNQRAQNFDNGWSAANTQAVQITGTSKEKTLLENIRSLVVAAVHDIYGTTNDVKYIYIVDLILTRVKEALKSIDVSSDLAAMHSEISEIAKNMAADSSRDEKAVADACIEQIKDELARYAAEQKEEFTKLKDSISDFVEAEHEVHIGSKDAEAIADAVSERLADDAAKVPQYDAKADIAVISDAVKSLRAVVLDAAQSATMAFAKLQTTIDMGFAKMTSSMSLVSSQLSESIQSQTKQLDTVNKISQSNDALMQEVRSISVPQIGSSSFIEALDDKLQPLLAVANKISSTTAEMSIMIAKVCLDSVKTKISIAAVNDHLDMMSTSIDSIYAKIDSLSTAGSNSPASIPSDFPKKTALEVMRLQNKHKSRLEKKFDEFVADFNGKISLMSQKSASWKDSLKMLMNSQFKRIKAGMSDLANRLSSVGGSIVSGVFKVISVLFAPIAFLVKGLFSMVSLVFKPLKWLLDLLTSPVFLVALGALFYLVIWPKIKEPLLKWYDETLKPVIGKVVEIFSGNKPFFDKVKDSLAVVWNEVGKPLINSVLDKLKEFATDVLWPFFKKHVWPYIKNNWKEILVGLGIFSFLSSPMSILSMALKAPTAILNTLKVASMATKAIVAGLPAMVSMLPVLIPAAIAAGAIAYFYNDWQKAEEQLREQCDKGFKDTQARAKEANENVQLSIQRINDLKKDNEKLFKKLDVKTSDDMVPEEIHTADGRITTAEFLKENVEKAAVLTRSASFDEAMEKIAKGQQKITAGQKEGIYARGFSRINAQFQALFNFANAFAADKLNHIGDDTLLQRHKVFIDMLNAERQRIGTQLQWYNSEIEDRWSSGSDEEWEKRFNDLAEQVKTWGANAIQYLTTNPSKLKGPSLNFSKIVDGKAVAMNQQEQAAELKRYNAELSKLSQADREQAMRAVHMGKAVSFNIDTAAYQAVNSRNQENIDNLVNDKQFAYNAVIQDLRDRQQSSVANDMQKVLESMKLALNDTKEDRKIREMVMDMAKNQATINLQTTGKGALTDEQQTQILAAAREKIKEMIAKGEDMTPQQKQRYQAQLDAIETNKELSSKIDAFIEKQEQKAAEEAKSKEKSGGTTNNTNVQQVNYVNGRSGSLDNVVDTTPRSA